MRAHFKEDGTLNLNYFYFYCKHYPNASEYDRFCLALLKTFRVYSLMFLTNCKLSVYKIDYIPKLSKNELQNGQVCMF